MNKYKCKTDKGSGCLSCKHIFEDKKQEPCCSCKMGGHFPNCPMVLSISYDHSRPECDGGKWEEQKENE